MSAVTPDAAGVVGACSRPWMPVLALPAGSDGPTAHDDAAFTREGAWHRFTDLTAEPVLADRLREMTPAHDGLADVATAFLASRFASPIALLAGAPAIGHGVSIVYAPEQLWLRQSPHGWFNGVAVTAPALGDVAGAAPRAVATFAPVVERLRRVGKLGERALWGQLADALATTAGHAHDATGDAERAAVDAAALLRAADPPLWVEPTFARVAVEVEGQEVVGLAWRRGSCCLAYRCERYELCTGCPLTPTEEWWEQSVASVRDRAVA